MSKEAFLSIFERQRKSGLSIREFCMNEAYSPTSFHYWSVNFAQRIFVVGRFGNPVAATYLGYRLLAANAFHYNDNLLSCGINALSLAPDLFEQRLAPGSIDGAPFRRGDRPCGTEGKLSFLGLMVVNLALKLNIFLSSKTLLSFPILLVHFLLTIYIVFITRYLPVSLLII